jgi:succinoglycan biosynthesis transport protein ExoP
MEANESDQSFQRTLAILRRRWYWIVLCFIVATGAAYALTKIQQKKYTAHSSVNFGGAQLAATLAGVPVLGQGGSSSVQDTNVLLLQLGGQTARKTAQIIGHGVTQATVAGALKISAVGDTTVVSIQATAASPRLAERIANVYGQVFVSDQKAAQQASLQHTLDALNRQFAKMSNPEQASPAGITLLQKIQSIEVVLAIGDASPVSVASTASIPRSPSSPTTKTNVILGAIFGLLLGLAVVFLLERIDRRIREPKDLEAIYGLPLLGVVPDSGALARSGRPGGATEGLPPRETEVFQLIRAHLRYFEVDRDLQTLLIASASTGEGKTTIARSLAMAAAQMGARVLLLEGDLRRPAIAEPFGLASGPGLADVLIGAVTLSEATQPIDLDPLGREVTRGRPLSVLVAGANPPPNPVELLESLAMERVLEQSRVAYDLVVIDTAPLAVVSDSFSLLRKVDGVIIVGRLGRARRDVALRLGQTLASGGSPQLGVIANGFKVRRNTPFGYALDYDSSDRVATPTLS